MQPESQLNQNSFGTAVAVDRVAGQQQRVLRNTYLLLALTLIPTGIGAMVGINLNFAFVRASPIISSLVLLAVIYGMFFAIEIKVAWLVAVDQRAGGDHLGVQARMARQQAMKIAAMTIGPIHHRRHAH